MGSRAIQGALRQAVEKHGLKPGTPLENRVLLQLHRCGLPIVQQYRVGKYRLDFAWPDLRIGLEADGWYHRSPDGAAKDRVRDSWLRSQGWVIFRADDEHGEQSLHDQVLRVADIVIEQRLASRLAPCPGVT